MSHRSRPKPSKAPLADGSVLLWIQEHQAKQKAADHIPGLTQKILWKSDLTPIDLLQLPIVPKGFMHRLTYINVAVEVGEENVTRGHSPNSNISKPIKLFKSGIEFTASMQPRSYIGSSIDAKGSYMRVVTHERQLHCQRKGEFGSMHYDFGSQAGVVPNFRLVGVWTNPRLLSNDEDTFQDIERNLFLFITKQHASLDATAFAQCHGIPMTMRLFLIRHGETVDNVAGLYAGSRDSALTAHGVLQARRLATHLAESVTVTHLFASNLGRAVRTAEAVWDAQKRAHQTGLEVVQLSELREKHFGTGEGVKFGVKGPKTEHHGAETPEAMKSRIDRFLDDYLAPLLVVGDESTVCIVSHGIILSVLFSSLCARLPAGSISAAPEATASSGPGPVRPSWSNTGYLEGVLSPLAVDEAEVKLPHKFFIKAVNCVDHVKGLKKTRGGIGSAKFDDKQKTMDAFFKSTS